jgi:DNA-binding NarL/FixJ family response regulator
MNTAADRWLAELGAGRTAPLPIAVVALAARLRSASPADRSPRLRVRTMTGRWAVLEASWMRSENPRSVAVIAREASPEEVMPIALTSFGLTRQECAVATLVFHGLSTRSLSQQLRISESTVQDHLKSIFDKTGVRSRRELVATVLRQGYLPRMLAGDRPGPSGRFPDPPDS